MPKKLFSFFITSLVAVFGVAMVPSDTEALSIALMPDCRVGGIVVGASFKEARPAGPMSFGNPEGYQFLVHVTGVELLDNEEYGDCAEIHKISYNRHYFFSLESLPSGMTTDSVLGYSISFQKGTGQTSGDPVFTARPEQLDFCTVEGVLVNDPFNSASLCMPGPGGNSCFADDSFDIQITKVQGINNHCRVNFPVGSKTSISLRSTNLLEKQNFTLEKGSKVRINGALEAGSSILRSLHGLVLASPKPDEKEEPKKPDEPKDEQDQEELTPILDTPIEPTKTATDSNFLVGILVGLLVGLGAVVITYLVKRKR